MGRTGKKKDTSDIENETLAEMINNLKKAPRFDTGNTPNEVALKRMAAEAGIDMKDSTVQWFVNLIRERMNGVRVGQADRLDLILKKYGGGSSRATQDSI